MRTRPGKVNVVVIGEGVGALLAALKLAEADRRVALLAEGDWTVPPGPAEWVVVPLVDGDTSRADYAAAGFTECIALGERFPGVISQIEGLWVGDVPAGGDRFVDGEAAVPSALGDVEPPAVQVPAVRIHVKRLYDALADALQDAGAEILRTRVRGVSVIEGRILGAVSEAARFDARHDVFASEDPARAYALSTMALEPITLRHGSVQLRRLPAKVDTPVFAAGGMLWPAEGHDWLLGDIPGTSVVAGEHIADIPMADPDVAPRIGQSERIVGAWHLLGTRGRLLEAIGSARTLSDAFLSSE